MKHTNPFSQDNLLMSVLIAAFLTITGLSLFSQPADVSDETSTAVIVSKTSQSVAPKMVM